MGGKSHNTPHLQDSQIATQEEFLLRLSDEIFWGYLYIYRANRIQEKPINIVELILGISKIKPVRPNQILLSLDKIDYGLEK